MTEKRPRSISVVEIPAHLRAMIDGDFRWQVCFGYMARLSKNNMLVQPDLCDWITANTRHPVKVHEDDVWFVDQDEALLCHMRFSGGS